MGNVINTNVASLNAQRNLTNTNNDLQTTFKRLSSGLRINSAKDDAAGLQIANRLSAQIGGLKQSSRNANDGISVAQTAEGALQESTNILLRIRDIAIQSANGTNGPEEREALQAEVEQLQVELNRIATTTRFGSNKLLDGSFSAVFQVGAKAYETIGFSIGNFDTETLGTTGGQAAVVTGTTASTFAVTSGNDEITFNVGINTAGTAPQTTNHVVTIPEGTYNSLDSLVAEINFQIGLDADLANKVVAANNNGTLEFRTPGTGADQAIGVAEESTLFGVGTTAVTDLGANTGGASVASIDISTAYGAQIGLAIADTAIKEIDSTRGDLGAIQNRLVTTISNLQNTSENVSAARSRIQDTDYAEETSALAKNQVLQQAGLSILSQANASSQSVLSLLQG